MIGRLVHCRRAAFALEQVAIAIAVVGILLAGIATYIPGRRDQALAKHSVRDAQTIADAAVRYRWRTGRWPSSVVELTAYELPANSPSSNGFGLPYVISGVANHVLVSTNIPLPAVPTLAGTGLSTVVAGGQTVVTVTRTLSDDGIAEPIYWKKHLYVE